ncbi:uncharacterized protein V1513DRAFT_485514 [Lipomyces chichibuensis]|uniref:uncharacterized protein n=1 Tax=Lipomyces chichibuensis TaxID=1546026 RepID=UPI0033433F5B
MASHDDERASYQRALNFLTANGPERRLDIYLSYKSFQSLEEKARAIYGDGDATASAVGLQQCISESIRDLLNRFDKKHLTSYILPVGGSTYSSVDDQGRRSTKTPDAGLKYDNGQHKDLLIIVEAGVPEGYRQLKADIELWLREFDSRIGILMWLKEKPSFNGHTWFGTLDIALIEVFKMEERTIRRADSLDIGLIMEDVFPFDEQLSSDEKAQQILLETELLFHIVQSEVHDTAIKRYIDSFQKTN